MLDTKTLTKTAINACRDTEKWLKSFVKKHAPKGTACECEELRVNDAEGDEYIFCEVTLACNKHKHCFNFYAGDESCVLVERLGGKKGDVANGDTYGKSFEMQFDMPSLDDMGTLEEFLEQLGDYVPKMPKQKPPKKAKHVYMLTTKTRDDKKSRGEYNRTETLYGTIEKARAAVVKQAKNILSRMHEIIDVSIGGNHYVNKETTLKALTSGIDSVSISGYIRDEYNFFGALIEEKDVL